MVNLNAARIAAWDDPDLSNLPVYELALDAVVGRCRGRNLHFSKAVEPAIAAADMVFLSVKTPTKTKVVGAGQSSDLRWIEASARHVAACAHGHSIVVEKSTLPVRTAATIKAILGALMVIRPKLLRPMPQQLDGLATGPSPGFEPCIPSRQANRK